MRHTCEVTTPEIRRVEISDAPAAAALATRAFMGEAFMFGMAGDGVLDRYLASHRIYSAEPWDDTALMMGAYLDELLIGIVRGSAVGQCTLCRTIDPSDPPADEARFKDWQFWVGVREVHAKYGPHGWISRMAVEPNAQGAGVGSLLIESIMGVLGQHGSGPVYLEALQERSGFYLRHGFEIVDEVPEPYADLSYLMVRNV
jgi:ribosomal protein S18 acetylase RimI-like enzyme